MEGENGSEQEQPVDPFVILQRHSLHTSLSSYRLAIGPLCTSEFFVAYLESYLEERQRKVERTIGKMRVSLVLFSTNSFKYAFFCMAGNILS